MAIRIFQMNDEEWWAGDCSPEELVVAYIKETGCTREEATDDPDGLPSELTGEDLDRLQFAYESLGDSSRRASFRVRLAELIAEGQTFPCLFASTYW